MGTRTETRHSDAGFTLTELLVAMGMAIVVGMAGYVVFETSNRSSVVQSNVSDAQQNARVAMDRLGRDLRSAGSGLPDPPFSITIGTQAFTSPLVISNSATAPDALTIVGGRALGGTLNQDGDATCNGDRDVFVCVNLAEKDNFLSGTSALPNRRQISVDGTQHHELATTGHVLTANIAKLRLAAGTLARDWSDGTRVFIIEAFTYAADTASAGCSAATPCLSVTDISGLRGSGVVADNIEDLQVAYGIDSSPRDGVIDDTNGDLTYTSADFVNTPPAPATASNTLAVRVNVVSRTRSPDQSKATFAPTCLEDRAGDAACTGAALDGYRRRALTKVVALRNPRTE